MCPDFPKAPGRFGRGWLLLALALGHAADLPIHADDLRGPKPTQKEYDAAREKYVADRRKAAADQVQRLQDERQAAEKALRDAKTDAEKQAAEKRRQQASLLPAMKMISPADGPGETFSPRFLAFAVNHPKSPTAMDAYYLALLTSGGPAGKVGTWGKAVKALQADQVKNPEVQRAVRLFRVLAGARDPAADQLLRDVMAQNPERRAQGRACQALAQGRARAADLADQLQRDPDRRRNAEELLGGKAGVEQLLADAPAARQEAAELIRTLRTQYDDVCPDLSIGKPAPEVVSQDLDGQPVKLSALKGKVVVLNFWGTWCAGCLAMIPQERELVGKLKDQPFVLVSISVDAEKETLRQFLAKEKMPWTHWWNGDQGGVIEDWDLETYPTVYVLDAKGVIRYQGLEGEKLAEAVTQLVAELAKKSD
jgi:thiol-disulfide isomerase/thioredoxin